MTSLIRTKALAALAAAVAVFALVAPTAAASATVTSAAAAADVSVVVQASGQLGDADAAIVAAGGTVTDRLDRFGMLTASVPADQLDGLRAADAVTSVTVDRDYAPLTKRGSSELGEPSRTAAATINADDLHADGITGAGVGIAVVDTGIQPRPGVSDNVIATVDVSGEGTRIDGYGHGTFMSGVIVGDDKGVAGIAPDAHLVGIKVADRKGGTSLSAVLRGLSAAIDARDRYGVRVVLLAIGRDVETDTDPLQSAVEQLWAEGLVVVVPAGNDGVLTTPGASPYVVTAGALNDAGTADAADDTVPDWSGRGPAARRAAADVLVPGVSLVSTRAPGSQIDRDNPQAQVDGRTFRGSGTSLSAAVAAGAAALVIDADPTLTPDQVKGRFAASAAPAPAGTDAAAALYGVLDVAAASAAVDAPAANTGLPAIETVERESDGVSYPSWQGHHWAASNWTADDFTGHHWAGHHWAAVTFEGHHWAGHHWAVDTFEGHHWAGHHWAGHHWAGHHWAGHHWAGHHWAGHHWAGHHWASDTWTGSHWG